MTRAFSIMYHDVVEDGAWDSSGFPGSAAGSYKLTRQDFAQHLAAVKRAVPAANTPLARSGTNARRCSSPLMTAA